MLTMDPKSDTIKGRVRGGLGRREPDKTQPGFIHSGIFGLTTCEECANIYREWIKQTNINRKRLLSRLHKGGHISDYAKGAHTPQT